MHMNNKKLKVLMLSHEFPPIGAGGAQTTRFIAKYVTKLGVNVNILTTRPGKELSLDHIDGYKVFYTGKIKKKYYTTHIPEMCLFIASAITDLKFIIEKVNPDIVHSFFAIPSGILGLHIKNKYKIPYIVSLLGADVPGFEIGDWRLNTYHFLTKHLSKAIWNNASSLIANSFSLKELSNKFTPDLDIKIITNGVDRNIFYPKSSSNYSTDKVNLVFASRLMMQKGIDSLIIACGILKNRGVNNFKLTVVGDGYLKGLMNSLIKKYDLKDNVDHIGWKRNDEIPEIFRESDVFILPSTMEGMSTVVLEAMSCGLPIIVTKVEGYSEILEDGVNGVTVEYGNHEKLADAIEKLIKSPKLREKMSQASIEKAKKFSWENIAEQYVEVYKKTLFISTDKKEKTLVTN